MNPLPRKVRVENVTQVSKDMTKFGYTTLEVGSRMQAPIQAAESTRRESSIEWASLDVMKVGQG